MVKRISLRIIRRNLGRGLAMSSVLGTVKHARYVLSSLAAVLFAVCSGA